MTRQIVGGVVVAFVVGLTPTGVAAQPVSPEQQIEEGLSPLPEAMRDDAEVKGYDESGALVTLREGAGLLTCIADDPAVRAYTVTCFHRDMEAYVTRSLELTKEGADTPGRLQTLQAEIDSGALTLPDRGVVYQRSGLDVDINDAAMLIFLPNATADGTGLTSLPSPQHPWLREPGTGQAHVSISMR
ncbi:MAG: hypothetical protein QGF21_11460 [Vicinamibacterales bacterium]|nr:hypothetical protein [Vicinamibacterales bacterium]MDP7672548.1 hypothetical protein [Vicinamibacterales bacterium]HJO39733.1 hypothetical protein [Vicinamibacterales bacterium]